MKPTYKTIGVDLRVLNKSTDKSFVYCSVSFGLGELNCFLKMNNLFIPHGQCVENQGKSYA